MSGKTLLNEPIGFRKKGLFRQFLCSEHNPYVQFIKYGIAGCIATAVHILIFYFSAALLFPAIGPGDVMSRFLGLPTTEATQDIIARNSFIDNFIAFFFSNLTAYLINIFWVFTPGRHHRIIEIGMFYLVSGLSIFVGSTLMWALVSYCGLMTTVAFSANIVVAVLINYATRKFVIFKG